VADLATAFVVLLLAELGDKSQLLALTFATRFRWWQVLVGVAVAATVLLGVASALGGALGALLPERAIAAVGGALFLGFAAWTGARVPAAGRDDDPDGTGATSTPGARSALPTVIGAFLVAELGDKSMFATAALAGARDPVAVWLGAAAGMTVAAGLAVAVGVLLHRRLPARRLQQVAVLAFALVGLVLIVEAVRG
jgi:Ca2+/H+ antiporter, TMEM165/GDT1 family